MLILTNIHFLLFQLHHTISSRVFLVHVSAVTSSHLQGVNIKWFTQQQSVISGTSYLHCYIVIAVSVLTHLWVGQDWCLDTGMYSVLYRHSFVYFVDMLGTTVIFDSLLLFYSFLYFIVLKLETHICDNDYVGMKVWCAIDDRLLLCEPFDVHCLKMAGSNSWNM
jgi:hypothetical protein